MLKGLMDRCTSHETMISHLREKVEARDSKLRELTAWKEVQINKLDYTRKLLEESEASVEALKEILKDKEGEITEAKNQLCQAREDAEREYRDSDVLLKELGGSFVDGFNDCFCQVKASFPDLDLSHVSIDAQAQTPAQLVYFEGTDELFVDDTNPDLQGDGDPGQVEQEKSIQVTTRHLEGDQVVKERNEETFIAQLQFFFITFVHLQEMYFFR